MGLNLDIFLSSLRADARRRVKRNTRKIGKAGVLPIIVLCGCLPPQMAQADELTSYPPCTEEPSASDVDAAKGVFQAGRISFEEGDYDRTILYWEDAFRRDCTAVKLLLNVARAYELKGDLERAVLALRTYLQRDSEIQDRAAVEKRLVKLTSRLEEERKEASAPKEEEESKPNATVPPAKAAKPKPTEASRPLWPVVTTAAGVAGLAVGATFAALGQKAVNNERDRIALGVSDASGRHCSRKGRKWECPSPELQQLLTEALDDSDELKRSKTERTVGLAVVGGGAIITGIGAYFWYTLWKKSDRPEATAVLPVVTSSYQGLSISGRF